MLHLAVATERCVWPDVTVINYRAAADHHWPANTRAPNYSALLDDYSSLDLRRTIYFAVITRLKHFKHKTIAFEQRIFFAGVNPPTLQYLVMHNLLLINEPLNSVGEIYNIGAGNETANRVLVDKLLALLGKDDSSVNYVADRLGHDRRYSVDIAKITALGWKRARSLDEALEQTVAWYRDNRWWWEPLKANK